MSTFVLSAPLRVTTWNVNSIRTRLPHVLDWLEAAECDVLCLQETKVTNDKFPVDAFTSRGWHVVHHGQQAYNGVALISRQPLRDVRVGLGDAVVDAQARCLRARLNGVEIINVYIPQGEAVDSPKFAFKEAFYAALHTCLARDYTPQTPLVLLGDFNVAPEPRDVDDAQKRDGRCMFTPAEHGWLHTLTAWGLHDALRLVTPDAGHFSWWDYREFAFQKNRGMRIDLIYVTSPLQGMVRQVRFDRAEREKPQPSDHIPVTVELVPAKS